MQCCKGRALSICISHPKGASAIGQALPHVINSLGHIFAVRVSPFLPSLLTYCPFCCLSLLRCFEMARNHAWVLWKSSVLAEVFTAPDTSFCAALGLKALQASHSAFCPHSLSGTLPQECHLYDSTFISASICFFCCISYLYPLWSQATLSLILLSAHTVHISLCHFMHESVLLW
jgi:hypothetical protein